VCARASVVSRTKYDSVQDLPVFIIYGRGLDRRVFDKRLVGCSSEVLSTFSVHVGFCGATYVL
jgi:hypothetical protein